MWRTSGAKPSSGSSPPPLVAPRRCEKVVAAMSTRDATSSPPLVPVSDRTEAQAGAPEAFQPSFARLRTASTCFASERCVSAQPTTAYSVACSTM
eukprot:6644468-Pyramimonas_sp.AAC.1